jgi:hypothetical protein
MEKTMKQETTYFEGEGREFLQACIDHAAEWCVRAGLRKLVIFTGTGDGPHYAAKELLSQKRYSNLQVIAVTPPFGRKYRTKPGDSASPVVRAGIHPGMQEELAALGIVVLAAHLPFKGIHSGTERASEWNRVAEAFGVLGGGFALCVQAAMIACDAGAVDGGERIVVASADTAFVALACRTESFLSPTEGLLVEHILCRPSRYTISKRSHEQIGQMWTPSETEQPAEKAFAIADDKLPVAKDVSAQAELDKKMHVHALPERAKRPRRKKTQ